MNDRALSQLRHESQGAGAARCEQADASLVCAGDLPGASDGATGKGGGTAGVPGGGTMGSRWAWVTAASIGLGVLVLGLCRWPWLYSGAFALSRSELPSVGGEPWIEGRVQRIAPDLGVAAEFLRSLECSRGALASLGSSSGSPADLAAKIRVEMTDEVGPLKVSLEGRDESRVLLLLEAVAKEFDRWAKRVRGEDLDRLGQSVEGQLAAAEGALQAAHASVTELRRQHGVIDFDEALSLCREQLARLEAAREEAQSKADTLEVQIRELQEEITRHHPALLAVRQELDRALLRYTDAHPKVQELRGTLGRLEARLKAAQGQAMADPDLAMEKSSLAQSLYARVIDLRGQHNRFQRQVAADDESRGRLREKLQALAAKQLDFAREQSRCESLRITRDTLVQSQAALGLSISQALPAFRVVHGPRVEGRSPLLHWPAGVGLAAGAMGASLLLSWVGFVCFGRRDGRIRSGRELEAATGLPLLGSLCDLSEMDDQARKRWAFETLATLKGVLTRASEEALVCGFVSLRHGEGRSTWVRILAQAAQDQGYKVLVVTSEADGERSGAKDGAELGIRSCEAGDSAGGGREIASPAEIPRLVQAAGAPPCLYLRPTKWVWNLRCRQEWRMAIEKCHGMENLVVLVELPPAVEAESLLLAENLSQVIWLCHKDKARVSETQKQIELYRLGRTKLVGAVFNRDRRAVALPVRRSGWRAAVAGLFLICTAGLWAQPSAAPPTPPAAEDAIPGGTVGVVSPAQMASWQKKLTLGPGDVLSISLYQQPETLRSGLTIGPDGRMNYLQVRDFEAGGLTVEELREKLEAALGKFYQPPLRVVILPQAYNSKKYYLLGNVVQKGVFPLDRPMTIMEAIARSQGFVTMGERRNTLMMADLSRSFLVRRDPTGGVRRVDVSFENLFLRGDLGQNVVLEPEDYLYFPPLDLKEVYVLGEVLRPGVMVHTPGMTLMRAIVGQGGFTEKAYRRKVLVVRGSLSQPQTFVVNVSDVLDAQAQDIRLEPKDIIYVSRRPWAKAEELVELAITEFLRAAVVTWVGQNVGPFITEPLIK